MPLPMTTAGYRRHSVVDEHAPTVRQPDGRDAPVLHGGSSHGIVVAHERALADVEETLDDAVDIGAHVGPDGRRGDALVLAPPTHDDDAVHGGGPGHLVGGDERRRVRQGGIDRRDCHGSRHVGVLGGPRDQRGMGPGCQEFRVLKSWHPVQDAQGGQRHRWSSSPAGWIHR